MCFLVSLGGLGSSDTLFPRSSAEKLGISQNVALSSPTQGSKTKEEPKEGEERHLLEIEALIGKRCGSPALFTGFQFSSPLLLSPLHPHSISFAPALDL